VSGQSEDEGEGSGQSEDGAGGRRKKGPIIYDLFALGVRLLMAGIFVYSGWPKLFDPISFQIKVNEYGILPVEYEQAFSIWLPRLMILCAVSVVPGVLARLGMLGYAGIEVVCELGEGLPTVNANPFALEQVLLNLLTNARDAVMGDRNSPRQITISPRQITISTRLAGGESNLVEMRVSDRGPGMPREVIDRVFEPFFTTKGPDRGTGLGLAICKNIVEQFGGRMAVSSKEGEGTKMFVLVPAAPAE